MDCVFLAFPSTFVLCEFFEIEPFTNDVAYKYHVIIGIVACSCLTFITEKVIANYVTTYYDRQLLKDKGIAFANMMDLLAK